MWQESSYGNGISNSAGQVSYIAFELDASNSFYLEGGAGVFTKLSSQWSFNLEAILGTYEWHSQMFAKAAVYWQPNDYLALGLYGKLSLFDTADSSDDIYIYSWNAGSTPSCFGKISLDGYQDMQIGLNAMLYF
jgi:hypothetical protein